MLRKVEEWYPLGDLSLAILTERLVTLLMIGSAHRFQTISLLKISNMRHSAEGYEFWVPEKIKTSRRGALQPLLRFSYFRDNPRLCIASNIDKYLEMTSELRDDCNNLISTLRKPYKAASPATISRWVRSTLVKCGINPEFTAYSTKHASTSAALKKGVGIEIIKKGSGLVGKIKSVCKTL